MATGMILQLIAIVMMAVVGGVVLWLHVRLDRLYSSANKLPMLHHRMTESLLGARSGLSQLRKDVSEVQPSIEKRMREANRAVQDLEFLTERAEKVLKRLDTSLQHAQDVENKQETTTATATPLIPKDVQAQVLEAATHTNGRVHENGAAAGFEPLLEQDIPIVETSTTSSKSEEALKAKLERIL